MQKQNNTTQEEKDLQTQKYLEKEINKGYKRVKKQQGSLSTTGIEDNPEMYYKLVRSGLSKKELQEIRLNGGF